MIQTSAFSNAKLEVVLTKRKSMFVFDYYSFSFLERGFRSNTFQVRAGLRKGLLISSKSEALLSSTLQPIFDHLLKIARTLSPSNHTYLSCLCFTAAGPNRLPAAN